MNDAPGQQLDRRPIIDLFSAMSIDGDAIIDISLPNDWSVLSIGESRTSYTVQFQVPTTEPAGEAGAGAPAALRITQVPDGSLAQLMFDGRQLDPIEFNGAPAFIDVGSPDPSLVNVFWLDGTTAFNASSSTSTLDAIAVFVESLEPVSVDDWNRRFATDAPEVATDPPACAPQPNFGPTLDI